MTQRSPRYLISLLFLVCATNLLVAQTRYYDVWQSRDSLGLDFRFGKPLPGNSVPQETIALIEGTGSICDRWTGELLFYSNGNTVWNRQHRPMPNGTGLAGGISSTLRALRGFDSRKDSLFLPDPYRGQSPVIVPHPGDSSLYFLFYFDPDESFSSTPERFNLVYAIVDMRGDGGLGEVIKKDVLLLSHTSSKLVAVRYGNGGGYWIVGHEMGSNRFFSWLITEKGIPAIPVISTAGKVYDSNYDQGMLKASPNGSRLFASHRFGYIERDTMKNPQPQVKGPSYGELLQFDHCTGVVGPVIDELPSGMCSSFSANNRFLYTSIADTLVQYDLQGGGGNILKTKKVLNPPGDQSHFYGMQLGPDGVIYAINAFSLVNYRICIIENADLPAPIGANYFILFYLECRPLNRARGHRIGLPNCIDGYLGETPVREQTDLTLALDGDTVLCRGEGLPMHAGGAGILRYEWTPSDWLSCADCADPVAWPLQRTTYRVVGFRYRPCPEVDGIRTPIDTLWVTIDVKDRLEADAGPDTVICAGESVQLHGKGEGKLQWSPADGLSCTDCADPVATPNETTIYEFRVIGENGCDGIDSVKVNLNRTEAHITASDTNICRGESVTLRATGGKEYRWSPADGLDCLDCIATRATPEKTTTYRVEATVDGICPSVDSITIVVHEPGLFDAGNDTAICVGQSIRLRARGGVRYSWAYNRTLECDTCADPMASPFVTTTYRVYIVDQNGCSAWDSVTVVVQSQPGMTALGDTAMCAGGTAFLSATGADGYQWSPAAGLSCSECPNPVATPVETTIYYVIGTNTSGGCPSLDSVRVEVQPMPIADAGHDTAICFGERLVLHGSGGAIYRWDSSPDLSCLDCSDPSLSPTATAVYYVTVFNDAKECSDRDSVRVEVRPVEVVTAGDDRGICAGDTVQLQATGGVRWLWEPADGLSCTDCPNPFAAPRQTTLYRLTGWNDAGCSAVDSLTVVVRQSGDVVRCRIGREHHGATDQLITIPVELIDPIIASDIAELDFEIEYDPRVMIVDAGSIQQFLKGTLLERWSVVLRQVRPGYSALHLIAPAGETLAGEGDLLRLEGRLYLSDAQGTELPFRLISPSYCFLFQTEAGYARLDSICGLNFRLIEVSGAKYAAPIAYPNPAVDRLRFTFGIGLDGPVRFQVFDASGKSVALLVNGLLKAGEYEVEWQVKSYLPGVYYCRLSSGDWNRTERVLIVE